MITAIDVLEHLNDEDLDKTLKNMRKYGIRFIFRIAFLGDETHGIPTDLNLFNDKTHKQFITKEKWINIIESHGIRIEPTPSTWLFHEQILIGR